MTQHSSVRYKPSVAIQCGSARLASSMEWHQRHSAHEQPKQWTTIMNPPNTPRDPSETSECPLKIQKEAGDDNPPQMKKRQMWQLLGAGSTLLPIAISCDSEIEAWTRIYPGSLGDEKSPNDSVYTLLNMFKSKNQENIDGNPEVVNNVKVEEQNAEEEIPQGKCENSSGEPEVLKFIEPEKHRYNTAVQDDLASIDEQTAFNDGAQSKGTSIHEEMNTGAPLKKDKRQCQLLDYIQQVDIYDCSTRQRASNLPIRKKNLNSTTNSTMSVSSVSSRPGVSNKGSPLRSLDPDIRQSSPDPAISRTGLLSATTNSALRHTEAFINRSKNRFMKIKRETSITENEDKV